jgi:hypothetical protein
MQSPDAHEPQAPVFASFTTSVGLALGELLLLAGIPEDLDRSLYSIQVCAQATLLSSELGRGDGRHGRVSSILRAALGVVRTWHEETEDLAALGEAVAVLQEVLEAMGVRYTAQEPPALESE